MYTIVYSSPYLQQGSMIFDNYNQAVSWFNQFCLGNNVKATLYKLCKKHSKIGSSYKFGKCCKVLDTNIIQ